jgi:hypothetical protein
MNVSAIMSGLGMLTGAVRGTAAVLPDRKTAAAAAPADSVSLSKGGLSRAMQETFLGGAGKDGAITLDEMRAFRDARLEEAGTILSGTLAGLGISRDATLGISVAPDNSVSVNGSLNAADRDRLRSALSADKDFVQAYNAASGASSVIASAEASEKFAGKYAENAKKAVENYSGLFGKTWDQELTFRNGTVGMRSV